LKQRPKLTAFAELLIWFSVRLGARLAIHCRCLGDGEVWVHAHVRLADGPQVGEGFALSLSFGQTLIQSGHLRVHRSQSPPCRFF
jgi:hypothetical protein